MWALPARRVVQFLEHAPSLVRGKRVVEVGAGTGLVGLALAAGAGARVCATDGDARVVELLRQNAGANGLLRDDGPLCSQVRGAQAQAQV